MLYGGYLFVFIIGTAVGSFLQVCIQRLPLGQSVLYPPSHCPACRRPLKFFELLPILSYLLLKGRCRYCSASISWQYPAVELFTGLLFLLAVAKFGFTLAALRVMVLFALLVPVTVIDFKYKVIPNQLNWAGLLLGLLLLLESKEVLLAGLIGLILGGGLFWFIALVSKGGMGGGDVKLAAVLGCLLGWQQLLVALFISFAAGSVVGLSMLLLRLTRWREPIPFGPYLALGAVVAALIGDKIIAWYNSGFW